MRLALGGGEAKETGEESEGFEGLWEGLEEDELGL